MDKDKDNDKNKRRARKTRKRARDLIGTPPPVQKHGNHKYDRRSAQREAEDLIEEALREYSN